MGMVTVPDCVIFAAGSRVPAATVQPYLQASPFVIAADGGYAFACDMGCVPDLVVGDFDSSACPQTSAEVLKFLPQKDDTDTALAVRQGVKRGFRRLVLFGGTGSRLDHTFANFLLCAAAAEQGAALTVVDMHHCIFSLQAETQRLSKTNRYISVFPFGGECTVTLQGFAYPLQNYTLNAFSGLGVSNEVTADFAEITVSSGRALVMCTDRD